MKLTRVAIVGTLALATAASAQQDPAAKAGLEAAAQALKGAQSLSYSLRSRGEGVFNIQPKVSCDIQMRRHAERPDRWMVRWSGSYDMGQGAQLLLAATDGFVVQWQEVESKTIEERAAGFAKGFIPETILQFAGRLAELEDPEPFKEHLAAPTIKGEGTAEHDGVTCDVILVDQGPGQPQFRWAIGPDHVPRRMEWILAGEGLTGSWIFEASGVALNPEIAPDRFVVPVPEGYKLNAPNRPDPATVAAAGAATGEGDAMRAPRGPGTSVGYIAPEFELVGADLEKGAPGESVKLSKLRGNVVVIDFWGTWCVPCRQSAPLVQALSEHFKDQKVKVYGLAVRERSDAAPINAFREAKHTYGLLIRADDVAKAYKVRSYPTLVVIGKEGEILFRHEGFDPDKNPFPRLTTLIEDYLAGKVQAPMPGAAGPEGDAPVGPPVPGGDDGGG